MGNVKMMTVCYCLLQFVLSTSLALKLLQLRVPPHKLQAGSATLRCVFDLEDAALYSVQWYKDGAEFYRFMPADTPPAQSFPLPGVTVDLSQGDESRVLLRLLSLESSGMYRCEVSSEAPHFLTVTAQAYMLVMALPRESPRISGLQEVYSLGEPIDVNCSSARSKPATLLTWYINDHEVKPNMNSVDAASGPWLSQYRMRIGSDRLEENTLGLRLPANTKFFPKLIMRLTCTATLGALNWHAQNWSFLKLVPGSAANRMQGSTWRWIFLIPLVQRIFYRNFFLISS